MLLDTDSWEEHHPGVNGGMTEISIVFFFLPLDRLRLPKPNTRYSAWWLKLRGLLRILAHHESKFEHVEAKLLHVTDMESHDNTISA